MKQLFIALAIVGLTLPFSSLHSDKKAVEQHLRSQIQRLIKYSIPQDDQYTIEIKMVQNNIKMEQHLPGLDLPVKTEGEVWGANIVLRIDPIVKKSIIEGIKKDVETAGILSDYDTIKYLHRTGYLTSGNRAFSGWKNTPYASRAKLSDLSIEQMNGMPNQMQYTMPKFEPTFSPLFEPKIEVQPQFNLQATLQPPPLSTVDQFLRFKEIALFFIFLIFLGLVTRHLKNWSSGWFAGGLEHITNVATHAGTSVGEKLDETVEVGKSAIRSLERQLESVALRVSTAIEVGFEKDRFLDDYDQRPARQPIAGVEPHTKEKCEQVLKPTKIPLNRNVQAMPPPPPSSQGVVIEDPLQVNLPTGTDLAAQFPTHSPLSEDINADDGGLMTFVNKLKILSWDEEKTELLRWLQGRDELALERLSKTYPSAVLLHYATPESVRQVCKAVYSRDLALIFKAKGLSELLNYLDKEKFDVVLLELEAVENSLARGEALDPGEVAQALANLKQSVLDNYGQQPEMYYNQDELLKGRIFNDPLRSAS